MAKLTKKQSIRLAIAQINCTVGDLEGNAEKIKQYIRRSKSFGVDIVVFPEMSLTGYPPEDLLLKKKFVQDNIDALKRISSLVEDIVAVVGFVDAKKAELYNAAAVLYKGKIRGVYQKTLLPNYGVFDEKRYFSSGRAPFTYGFGKAVIGVNICEDIWDLEGPAKIEAKLGAKLIININASPYHAEKFKEREAVVLAQAKQNKAFVVYANLVGGQDELVFDGQSMVVSPAGKVIARAEAFKEDLLMVDLDVPVLAVRNKSKVVTLADKIAPKERAALPKRNTAPLELVPEVYQALLLGLKDYVAKNGFKKVVIGLSGGIDSALVATLAVDALGRENVFGAFMPTRYSSKESEDDSIQLAQNLGIKLMNISIEQIYKIYLLVLEPHFLGSEKNIAEENLQARIRGNILMALSNKFGWLVLTTGNKSEMSTGYATLYGDMAGGFAVIKDVPKVLVYKLSKYRNSLSPVIPERIITKEPTAELKPNQKDSDTLPVYDLLDPILKAYVEEDLDLASIVKMGYDPATVSRVLNMVDKSEYKRRQSPPGIKITPKAFGRDRRMPITNRYKG